MQHFFSAICNFVLTVPLYFSWPHLRAQSPRISISRANGLVSVTAFHPEIHKSRNLPGDNFHGILFPTFHRFDEKKNQNENRI